MTNDRRRLCYLIVAAFTITPVCAFAQEDGAAGLKKIFGRYVGKPLDAEQKQLLDVAQKIVVAGKRRWKDDEKAIGDLNKLQGLVDKVKDVKTLKEGDVLSLLFISALTDNYAKRLLQKDRPARIIKGMALCAQHKHPKEGAEMISVHFREEIDFQQGERLTLRYAERDGSKGQVLGDLVVLAAKGKGVAGFYHGPYIGVEDIVVDTRDVKRLGDAEFKLAEKKRATGRVHFYNPSPIALEFFIHSWYDDQGKIHNVYDQSSGWKVTPKDVVYPAPPRGRNDERYLYASAINYRIKTKDGVHVISGTAFPKRMTRDGKLTGTLGVRATTDKATLIKAYENDPELAKFNAFLAVGSEVLARYADNKKGWVAAATSVTARTLRDRSIREALKNDFFDLDDDSVENVQIVLSLALDDRLNISAAREEASKREIIAALRRKDPDLAKVSAVADFIYKTVTAKSAQGSP